MLTATILCSSWRPERQPHWDTILETISITSTTTLSSSRVSTVLSSVNSTIWLEVVSSSTSCRWKSVVCKVQRSLTTTRRRSSGSSIFLLSRWRGECSDALNSLILCLTHRCASLSSCLTLSSTINLMKLETTLRNQTECSRSDFTQMKVKDVWT